MPRPKRTTKDFDQAIDRLASLLNFGHLLASMSGASLLESASDEIERLRKAAQAVPVESADALGPIQKLRNLMNALADDSMEMSDEEIEAEVRAEGLDPQEAAQRMRERVRATAEGAREPPAEEGER